MKKYMVMLILALNLSGPAPALTNYDGKWYKPFNSEVFHNVLETVGAGNHVWFRTENGIGRLNTVTGKTVFLSFSSMEVDVQDFSADFQFITGGDSTHVALYMSENARTAFLVFDGISWKKIFGSPVNPSKAKLFLDNHGRLLICNNMGIRRFTESDTGSGAWELLDIESLVNPSEDGDWVEPRGVEYYTFDDSGYLWMGFLDGSPTTLCRFDGSRLDTVASLPMYLQNFLTSPDGTIWIVNLEHDIFKLGQDRKLIQTKQVYWVEAIDVNSSAWYYRASADKYLLYKTDLNSETTVIADTLETLAELTAAGNGVYAFEIKRSDYNYYPSDGSVHSRLSLKTWDNSACGNLSRQTLFRKDGSIISGSSNALREYKNNACREIPKFNQGFRLLERVDGTVLAYGLGWNGLDGAFALKDSAWEIITGTDNIHFCSMMADSKGKIWGIARLSRDLVLVHQRDNGWAIIYSIDSNLPYRSIEERLFPDYYLSPFTEDKEGNVWAHIDSSTAWKTSDGYEWTLFNQENSNLPGNIYRLYRDTSGNIAALCIAENQDNGNSGSTIIKAAFNGSDWSLDSIICPVSLGKNSKDSLYDDFSSFIDSVPYDLKLFVDSRGDFWINNYRRRSSSENYSLYRYTDSTWIHYNPSNIPYSITWIIGEDASGNIYFNDKFNETVVFAPNAIDVPVKRSLPVKSMPLSCRVSEGNIFVDYTISQPGKIALSLYSIQGKLIKTLYSGPWNKGPCQQNFTVNCAPGIYFVRLSSPAGNQVSRVVLRR